MAKQVSGTLYAAAAFVLVLTASPQPAAAQDSGSCFASFDRDFGDFRNSNPMNSNWSARDTLQWSYFMGEQGLNILLKYQSCMDPGDFATNFQALTGMRDKGRDGCQALNSGASACTPTYPGS